MADIALRFHKDMLVLTTPTRAALERQGVDVDHDLEMVMMVEPESLQDVYRVEMATQAQCLVTETANLLPARLLHKKLEKRLCDLVKVSMELALEQKAQHVIVELGPTGLPLDPSSKTSLVENRDQYVRAAHEFEVYPFDAYLLNDFTRADALKCALMGLRKASDKPVMASVVVGEDGLLPDGKTTLEDAVAVMQEYEASVAGIRTKADPQRAAALAKRMAASCDLPLMVQLDVAKRDARQLNPQESNPYFCPETMFDAVPHLRSAGVQFVRAVGQATPAYTGALSAILKGLDVIDVRGLLED